MYFEEVLPDLVKSNRGNPQTAEIGGFLLVESVGSVEIGFRCKDPPTDPPESGLGFGNCRRPVTGVRLGGFRTNHFQIRLFGMVGWVGSTGDLDSPSCVDYSLVWLCG